VKKVKVGMTATHHQTMQMKFNKLNFFSTMKSRGNKSNKVCQGMPFYIYLRSLNFYMFLVSGFTTVKSTIFKQAVELGTTCTPAFADRVTHLVASGHGGAKYMVSLSNVTHA
jgi:hypothetical protein